MDTNRFRQSIAELKKIQKKYGTSYYFATLFFPRDIKNAVFALYAFVRVADEFVDNPKDNTDPKDALKLWKDQWQTAYQTKESDNPILYAAAYVFHTYNIPFELSIQFLDAMMADTVTTRYTTYTELEHYMDGSAGTVGVMLSYIIGFTDPHTLKYARTLGHAMQLTNFLRDIREDYEDRGRIYMPRVELEIHHISEDDIKNHMVSPEFKHFMEFQINRARRLYGEAELGISLLNRRGHLPVRLASRLYEFILNKIEKNNLDIYKERAHSTLFEKLHILIHTYVTTK